MTLQFCAGCSGNFANEQFKNAKGRPTKQCKSCLERGRTRRVQLKRVQCETEEEDSQRKRMHCETEEDIQSAAGEDGLNANTFAIEDFKDRCRRVADRAQVELSACIDMETCEDQKGFAYQLRDMILEATGFYFIIQNMKRRASANKMITYFRFYCSQDSKHQKKKKRSKNANAKQRDRINMKRYDCASGLTITTNLYTHQATVMLKHHCHPVYVDVRVQEDIKEYIAAHLDDTPQKLFFDIMQNKNISNLTQSQVYHWWLRLNQRHWKLAEDQMESAIKLLGNNEDKMEKIPVAVPGVNALGFSFPNAMAKHAGTTEIGMDATYKTNQKNMELFSVIANMDGVGFPLGYLLLSATEEIKAHDKTKAIEQFCRHFKDCGISPSYVMLDKDVAEINAVQVIWPNAKIQICYWHARKAVKKRLAQSHATKEYNPKKAMDEFDFVEKTFTPALIQQTGPFCPAAIRNQILEIFSRHFNQHPLISRRAATEIRRTAVREMYNMCKENQLPQVWAYMWNSWYCTMQWRLWTRSSDAGIPQLRTTMMVESHWRRVKHDYLHLFNRPRLDLLVYILVTKLQVIYDRKLAFLDQETRFRGLTPWRKEFKAEWRKLEIAQGQNSEYDTSPTDWTCSCPAFLMSRFLVCKHLVKSVHRIDGSSSFFRSVKRRYQPPFYRHPDLIALSDSSEDSETDNSSSEDEDFEETGYSDFELNFDNEAEDSMETGDNEAMMDGSTVNTWEEGRSAATALLAEIQELIDDQNQKGGSSRWIQKVLKEMQGLKRMKEDIEKLRVRRTMPRTWKDTNQSTMFFKF